GGGAEGSECLGDCVRVGEDPKLRRGLGRQLRQQQAGKGLVPLDLRAGPRRPNGACALRHQRVDDPRGERLVGAYHRDVDRALAGERRHGPRVADVSDRVAAPGRLGVTDERGIAVAHEHMQLALLSHAKGEGALPAAVPDDQGTHASQTTYTPAMALIHTCYRITDIDRSVAFYRALGFEEVGRIPIRDEAINVFMNQPGDGDSPRLELTSNHGKTAPYDSGTGYGHIAITPDALDATPAALKKQGIDPEKPPYSIREGGNRLCFVRDPD